MMTTQNLQTSQPTSKTAKPYKGMAMEGFIAKWYTKIRTRDEAIPLAVATVSENTPAAGQVLEVAPGPGYLAIELAKLGKFQVTGLDISKSFVEIAQAKAKEAGVAVDFRLGNASAMPFAAETFDFIICRAAFKNFTEPVQALREMHRVLKPGGKALIEDLRGDASMEEIAAHVHQMGLNRLNTWLTNWSFKTMLLKNAYTATEIRRMVAQTSFAGCEIREDEIGMVIWLEK
jgi:ubiquinone/menaquinone biosynthesis C-methylase UbiE